MSGRACHFPLLKICFFCLQYMYIRQGAEKFIGWKVHWLKSSNNDVISAGDDFSINRNIDEISLDTATANVYNVPWKCLRQPMNCSTNPRLKKKYIYINVWVCVCERERERERVCKVFYVSQSTSYFRFGWF